MLKDKQVCSCCGQTISPRKENLSRGIVETLIKFYVYVSNGGTNRFHPRKDLDLSKSEYNNFQKLRYHALIAKCDDVSGYWLITRRGFNFLTNSERIPKSVWILNNRIQDRDTQLCGIKDIMRDTTVPYFPTIEDIEYGEPIFKGGLF
jgi:hypothetical protein